MARYKSKYSYGAKNPLANYKLVSYVALSILIVLAQTVSIWFYNGPKVDEAEMVLYGAGFLGGDLDPGWDIYGHLGMYILGLIYFIAGCITILLGVFDSLIEFGAHFLGKGYFFMIARATMAAAILVAILIFMRMLHRHNAPMVLILIFFVTLAISPATIKYSNYVRTDTFVALFTVCALYFSVSANSFRSLVYMAFFTAAAVACKISALPIMGALALLSIRLCWLERISFRQLILVGVLAISFTFLLSPYMDYFGVFKHMLVSETGEASNPFRTHYVGLSTRLEQIVQFHVSAIGAVTCVFAGLALPAAYFSKYRKLTVLLVLYLFLTLLPYSVGSTLRDYWFIPSYLLTSLLALTFVIAVCDFVSRKLPGSLHKIFNAVVVVLVVLLPMNAAARHYVSIINHLNGPVSNKQAAQKWLEENHLGSDSILIDKNFMSVYPKLYDPAYLQVSRTSSGMFGHFKDKNRYLAEIFEYFLYENYLENLGMPEMKQRLLSLKKLRVDFAKSASYIETPRLCSYYSRNCHDLSLSGLHNIELVSDKDNTMTIKVLGDDPYLIFDVDAPISIDRSFFASVTSDADAWKLYYDFGEGTSEALSSPYFYKSRHIDIGVHAIKPVLNHLGYGEDPRRKVDSARRIMFVTSESGYARFYRLRSVPDARLTSGEKHAKKLLSWHDELTTLPLIKRFDGPVGSPIDIYDLSSYSLDNIE